MPKNTATAPTIPREQRGDLLNRINQEIIQNRVSAVSPSRRTTTTTTTPPPTPVDITQVPEGMRTGPVAPAPVDITQVPEGMQTGPVAPTPVGPTTDQTVPTDPTQPITDQVSTSSLFDAATTKIKEVLGGRDQDIGQIVKAIQGLGELRTSAFDKLYGEDSRISRFFQPSLRAVEEQILDTESLLTTLRSDIQESQADTELSQAQFNRIEAKERGTLVDQFDKLARARSRLQAGLDLELQMTDREFQNTLSAAQDNIDALTFELEQSGLADETEIGLIKQALQADLNEQAATLAENRKIAQEIRAEEAQIRAEDRTEKAKNTKERADAVKDILAKAQEFVLEAGIIPTNNFKKVIDDATRMAEEGKSLAEIQLGVLQAIGSNPDVRNYMNLQFQAAKDKLSSKSSSGGRQASATEDDNGFTFELPPTRSGGQPVDSFAKVQDYIKQTF